MKSALIPKLFGDNLGKAACLYRDMLDVCEDYTGVPHKLVSAVMDEFGNATETRGEQSKKNLRGAVFEFVIGEVLLLESVTPIYYQAQLLNVPLACFDWFLYHPKYPVSISCKTSARERWKQAAYEGMALKRVYPQSLNYLVSIEPVAKIEEKKEEAPQTIDHFVIASDPAFDDAIAEIKKLSYCIAERISPIVGSSRLVNED